MTSQDTLTADRVLATDLDGTFLPLAENTENQRDLRTLADQLRARGTTLVFVTGRHLASIEAAMRLHQLPRPQWIIGDVGTTVYRCPPSAVGPYEPVADYEHELARIIGDVPLARVREKLQQLAGLRLQEAEKQGKFKLSYYAPASRLDELVQAIRGELELIAAPYSIISSVDPFNGDGLIDLLPTGVSKSYALAWWSQHEKKPPQSIVFAGDSGNDLAALVAGYRSILVGNADRGLAQQVHAAHREAQWHDRLFLAQKHATSGVLEGCRWFGLATPDGSTSSCSRLGATPVRYDATTFRVWAPQRKRVAVEWQTGGSPTPLVRTEDGFFVGTVEGAGPGTRYRYCLDGQTSRPDPASGYQPDGVHGRSQVTDPRGFPWSDAQWRGIAKRDLVIYELHVGAFTQEGTFPAALGLLDELVDLGVTAIEVMPVAQSAGRWNWGYDGVNLFAVRNTYGTPDDFRMFVDACHAKGLAVILDVVYNHLGPEGNYLAEFGPYFSSRHHTPWGDAFNFDGERAAIVRDFVLENARYWLEEFHLDGLRMDAVHFMLDDQQPSILDELRRRVAELADRTSRTLHLIAESNLYDQALLDSNEFRPAYDAIWCDCLMHSIYTHGVPSLRLTRRVYQGADDVAEALQFGYVFSTPDQQRTSREAKTKRHDGKHGKAHIASLVTALQTHDAVGNHPHGRRLHQLTSADFQKAAASLTLMYPSIAMVFMGEEWADDSPFPFFVDFEDPRLREAVDLGRAREYTQHDWQGAPPPSDKETYFSSKLSHQRDRKDMWQWYQSLIQLRKQGLAAGWLTPQRLQVTHDTQRNVFSLQYARDAHVPLVIHARLSRPGDAESAAIIVAEGSVLLSSRKDTLSEAGTIQLRPNHAVIMG